MYCMPLRTIVYQMNLVFYVSRMSNKHFYKCSILLKQKINFSEKSSWYFCTVNSECLRAV